MSKVILAIFGVLTVGSIGLSTMHTGTGVLTPSVEHPSKSVRQGSSHFFGFIGGGGSSGRVK
ncbi:MAG: hypothetical protein HOI95_17760 [Chromatiales bacterium]|nr:hypothetical protein [Chromatiales bacterium]